jgi:hypothetical protein
MSLRGVLGALQAVAATAVECELAAEFGVAWVPRADRERPFSPGLMAQWSAPPTCRPFRQGGTYVSPPLSASLWERCERPYPIRVYVNQALSPVLLALRPDRPLMPYRRRITMRWQSGGGHCTFRVHPSDTVQAQASDP